MGINNGCESVIDKDESVIDINEMLSKIWNNKRFILKLALIFFLISIVISFSIPKEFTSNAVLAPEYGSNAGNSNATALAAMAGVSLPGGSSVDILSPDLYPQIIKSTPFIINLLDIDVTDEKGKFSGSFYDYMDEEIRSPWWNYILGIPSRTISAVVSVFKTKAGHNQTGDSGINYFNLSPRQASIINAIRSRINADTDKKNGTTIVTVELQDPLISAVIADSVLSNLQNYIIDYRTNKARKDLLFVESLHKEAYQNFNKAQQIYADYADRNQNVILHRRLAQQKYLENELSLAFGVYNQTAQQLTMAKAKVAEETPVFTILEPVKVPNMATSPRKKVIIIGFTFLGFIIGILWILFRDYIHLNKKEAVDL